MLRFIAAERVLRMVFLLHHHGLESKHLRSESEEPPSVGCIAVAWFSYQAKQQATFGRCLNFNIF